VEELQQLRQELEELKSAFYSFKGQHWTPDGYLRYESLPQLVGGVTHSAGSEEVLAGDRWEYIAPTTTSGQGDRVADLTADGTYNVLDVTETGKLLTIGGIINNANTGSWNGTETSIGTLRITVDGGTAQDHLIIFGQQFNSAILPWVPAADRQLTGGAFPNNIGLSPFNDRFSLPLNFEYSTSLRVDFVVSSATGWAAGENWDINIIVHRARLVSV